MVDPVSQKNVADRLKDYYKRKKPENAGAAGGLGIDHPE
jgi:hypothetical protein